MRMTAEQREQLDAMARKVRERREQATKKPWPLQPHRDSDYPESEDFAVRSSRADVAAPPAKDEICGSCQEDRKLIRNARPV